MHRRPLDSQSYEYRRAFLGDALKGLTDRPPLLRRFPNKIPPDDRQNVVSPSLEYAAERSMQTSGHITLEDAAVGPTMVCRTRIRKNIENRYKRHLCLGEENKTNREPSTLSHVNLRVIAFFTGSKPGNILKQK